MFFEKDEDKALQDLKAGFPAAAFHQITDKFQQDALFVFQEDWRQLDQVKLHLAGSSFQLKVWESLLKIPMGHLNTYGDIAHSIDKPNASRR